MAAEAAATGALPPTGPISIGWRIASRLLPLVPHGRAIAQRGIACFAIPWRKTVIVAPSRAMGNDLEIPQRSLQALQTLFYAFGFRPGRHWQVEYAGTELLPDDVRRQNLIVLGGPVVNPFTRELLKHPDFQCEVSYAGDDTRREFLWHNHRFTWNENTDYALLAVGPNPFLSTRRATLLFGLREIGTWAAARAFAERDYGWLRKEVHRHHSSRQSRTAVLLRVDHSADERKIGSVRLTTPRTDGEPIVRPSTTVGITPAGLEASLDEIANSLKSHPRKVVFSDVRHTVRVSADFAQIIEEEMTWRADGTDIVHYVKQYAGTSDMMGVDEMQFSATVVEGSRKLVAVPALNAPRKKRFLLFPIPPVRAVEPQGMRIRISARWPGALAGLARVNGTDDFTLKLSPLQVAGPVDRVTVRVEFEPSGARFRVEEQFEVPPGHVTGQEYGELRPYELQLHGVVPGTEYTFQLRRIR